MTAMLIALLLGQKAAVPAPQAAGCSDGALVSCTLAGCAIAAKECIGGGWTPCWCLYQTCNDGNACTTDGKSGFQCTHTPVNVNDGNACTTDACNTTTGAITHTSVNVNDGNACTIDACNTITGAITHTAVNVDDGNVCTADSCNTTTGAITHAPRTGATCNDSNACTNGDVCTVAKTCVGTPKNVYDGNPCTADTCDPVTGVTNPATPGAPCDDGTQCTTADACTAAKTCVGTPKPTDDGIACTADACNATTGLVTHTLACTDAATYFCHDAYGRVTRKAVCVRDQSCDASCN
jgi:hypothetical protein